MRKTRIAVATATVAAGLTCAVASSAPATPPGNYGGCVSSGVVSPADSIVGPFPTANTSAQDAGALHAFIQSNGHSRFTVPGLCPHG
jgi:hypothetical protein